MSTRKNKCLYCNSVFDNNTSLKNHLVNDCTKLESVPQPAQFECELCGKNFTSQFNLRRHLNNAVCVNHSNTCENCGKSFTSRITLRRHTQKCVDNTYFCDICNKHLINAKSYKYHNRKVHHNFTGINFYCGLCDKNFESSKSFDLHQASHAANKTAFKQIQTALDKSYTLYRKNNDSIHFKDILAEEENILELIKTINLNSPAVKINIGVSGNFVKHDPTSENNVRIAEQLFHLRSRNYELNGGQNINDVKKFIKNSFDTITVNYDNLINLEGSNWVFDRLISTDVQIHKILGVNN